ncbi:MAG: DUF3575 domain-containing protein [Bacteroidales bacterium]|nr:DUF3575 domain-containing protein [Bacteroidales bacterium]
MTGFVQAAVSCLLLLATPVLSHAQSADSLFIRFQLDSTSIDMSYDGNAARWEQFETNFRQQYAGRNSVGIQVDIFAGASPEGSRNHNMALGQGRAESIAALLRERLGDRVGTIDIHNLGPRWDDLYDMVAASNEPWRDEVLNIIKADVKADPQWLDPREMRLRGLHGGKVWKVLLTNYLAPLRSGGGSGGTAVVSWHPERDTIVIRDTVVIREEPAPREKDTIVIIHENFVAGVPVVVNTRKERQLADQTKSWALKTNFLLWGVVAPNIEAEIPLGDNNRWSLEFEAFTPWFIWNRNAQASQFINLGVEGRYWLGDRKYHRWLDGWHIGVALAGGYYDWEWMKSDGYQGEYLNAYFNVGWQHRFGEHWAIDLGIGIGAMGTQYRHYYGGSVYPEGREEEWDQHLIWHDTGYFLWPGPCHVNISLVYLFNFKDKKTPKR